MQCRALLQQQGMCTAKLGQDTTTPLHASLSITAAGHLRPASHTKHLSRKDSQQQPGLENCTNKSLPSAESERESTAEHLHRCCLIMQHVELPRATTRLKET